LRVTDLPSLESLRCFVEAASALNFTVAARAVHLTPAALGKRIHLLETQLGVTLFVRTTRRVSLTARGLQLLPAARAAIAAAQRCFGTDEDLGLSGEVTLGTRHELGLSWLLPIVARAQKLAPRLTLHLYFGSGPDLVNRVRLREIDAAVTSTRLTDPALDFTRLHEEEYSFVGAPRLLERVPLASATDAKHHTLLDATAELPLFRYWRDARGGIDSMRFSRVVRLGTIAAIREFVLAGGGVAVLPSYFIASDLRAKRLKIVMPRVRPMRDHFRLIFRADDGRRPVFEWLTTLMLQRALS
jgi:LysR family transcriptional regulator, glycine cleavage system transcriptional activator